MTEKLTSRKSINFLVLLCAAVYFVSYFTRINYAAVLVEIIDSEGYSKVEASAPLTGLFISYGFGQILSGWLSDRYKPEIILFAGLLLTAAMNGLIPLCGSVILISAVWFVNGFAQALIWPPIVRILTAYLTVKDYQEKIFIISWSSSVGTVAVYIFAPFIIKRCGWRPVFFISASLAAVTAVIWLAAINRIRKKAAVSVQKEYCQESQRYSSLIKDGRAVFIVVLTLAVIAVHGILRDGISSWMPTYISETYSVENTVSIISSIGLPVFSMAATWLSSYINKKFIRNEAACSAFWFICSIIFNSILYSAYDLSPALSIAMLTAVYGCSNGINLMFTCTVIPYFRKYGKVSFFTGLFNSATYVGSAVSMYAAAGITTRFGWKGAVLMWLAAGLCGAALSLAMVKPLQSFKRNSL